MLADGVAQGDVVTLSDANQWTHTYTGLAQKQAGKDVVYNVQEVTVPTGYTSSVASAAGNVTITNNYTPEITEVVGTKTWDDANNQDGKRPTNVTVNLLADGVEVADTVVDEASNWAYKFTNLPVYANGQAVVYTVTEEAVADYTTVINGFNITNSYTPDLTSLIVTKAWDDQNNHDKIRPEKVQIQLLADGKAQGAAVELTAEMKWTYTWTGLAAKKDGQAVAYTVQEVSVPKGNTATVTTKDATNVLVTNTHKVTPVPVKPTKPVKPSKPVKTNPKLPKTGETSSSILWTVGFMLVTAGLWISKRKGN